MARLAGRPALDVSALLASVLSERLQGYTLRGERSMGFTGAVVAEVLKPLAVQPADTPSSSDWTTQVDCELTGGEHSLMFLKHVVASKPADDADDGAKLLAVHASVAFAALITFHHIPPACSDNML